MTATKTIAEVGSVSHGTLRTCDLLDAFMGALETLDPQRAGNLWDNRTAALSWLEASEDEREAMPDGEEEAQYLVDDLYDILDEYAPEGTTFGAHEGDGSDFGFWPYDNEDFAGRA